MISIPCVAGSQSSSLKRSHMKTEQIATYNPGFLVFQPGLSKNASGNLNLPGLPLQTVVCGFPGKDLLTSQPAAGRTCWGASSPCRLCTCPGTTPPRSRSLSCCLWGPILLLSRYPLGIVLWEGGADGLSKEEVVEAGREVGGVALPEIQGGFSCTSGACGPRLAAQVQGLLVQPLLTPPCLLPL